MNLVFGEVVEVLSEDGMRMGKICVGGAQRKVALELIQDAAPGDLVLLCDGVAISKVAPAENSPAPASTPQDIDHVPRHSR
jgi:hydrogenase maturation factor